MGAVVISVIQWTVLLSLFARRYCQFDEEGYRCEYIRTNLCKDMGYNQTILPNFLGHMTQDDAAKGFSEFMPLIKVNCSYQLRPLLCLHYFPVCNVLMTPIPPCRLLCQQARQGCETLMVKFGFKWPAFLECDNFQVKGLCTGENMTASHNQTSDNKANNQRVIWVTPPSFNRTKIVFAPYEEDDDDFSVTDSGENIPAFLLLSSWHKILLYDMSTQDLITLYSGLDQGASVDFHFKKAYVYWASHGDSRIFRGHLILDVLTDVKVIVDVGLPTIDSLAVDWISGYLFWLESYPSKIRVANIDGEYPTDVLTEHLTNPKSLIIDPGSGYLFWINLIGTLYSPFATIERFDLTTKGHTVLFNVTQAILPKMGRPIGLTSDLQVRRLYWVDAKSESIQSISYDGTDFRVLVESAQSFPSHKFLSEPCSVAIFRDSVFWTDRATQTIAKFAKNGESRVMRLETLTASPPMDMKVFHKKSQPISESSVSYKITLNRSSISFASVHGTTTCSNDDKHLNQCSLLTAELLGISVLVLISLTLTERFDHRLS